MLRSDRRWSCSRKELMEEHLSRAHKQAKVLMRMKETDKCSGKIKETNETMSNGEMVLIRQKRRDISLQSKMSPNKAGPASSNRDGRKGKEGSEDFGNSGTSGRYLNLPASPFQFSWSPSSSIIVLSHKRPFDFYLSSLVLWSLNQEFLRLSFSFFMFSSIVRTASPPTLLILLLPRNVLYDSSLVSQFCLQ